MGDEGDVAESWDDELLDDLLMMPSTLVPLLLIVFILLWFWYRWGDLIVFGGVADWCFTSSTTVIASWTLPLPSKTSAAQHKRFCIEILKRKERKFGLEREIVNKFLPSVQITLSKFDLRFSCARRWNMEKSKLKLFSTLIIFLIPKSVKTSKS